MCYLVVDRRTGEFVRGLSEHVKEEIFLLRKIRADFSTNFAHSPTCCLPNSSQMCNIPRRYEIAHPDDSQTLEIDSSSCYLKLRLLRLTRTCKSAIEVSRFTPASMKPCCNAKNSETQKSLQNPSCGDIVSFPGLGSLCFDTA